MMHTKLPGVKDKSTEYLAKAMSRTDKNEVPVSTAADWVEMQTTQTGKEVVAVLNNLISAVKTIPEVIAFPGSQIASIMMVPITRIDTEGNACMAMSGGAGINVSMTPNLWERWCGLLKSAAITKDIKCRLSGMTEPNAVTSIADSMKIDELVKKKIETVLDVFANQAMYPN